MKLFTKEVDKQLFAQYPKGSDLDNQMVVAKIFNPYGRGVWYLLNSDPEDPDYIWAIVDLFEPEMGSVSRSELQTIKVPPFGLGLERDIYFTPKPAKEVFEGVLSGKRYAAGGMTPGRYYIDNSGNELRYVGESQGKLLFKDGENIVYKTEEDFEERPKETKLFGFFADGGRVKGRNNQTGETFGVVIGSVKKADDFDGGGIQMNVRTSYGSRISESTLYFDNNGNLLSITDYGYGLEGNYPETSGGSGRSYNADKKETIKVLSDMYSPAFAKRLVELAKGDKMAHGGQTKGKRYTVNVYYGGEMEDDEVYTDSLEEAKRISQGGEHSEIYDNEKKEFVEIEYADGGKIYSTDMKPHFSGNDRYIVKSDKGEEVFLSTKEFNEYIKKLEKEGYKKMADGGEIESEAKRLADNSNWTNEKLQAEYDSNKRDLQNFNNGFLKPSKVIGGGYKSSAVAKRLAKEFLEKNVATYKKALEIRGVMAKGGEVDTYEVELSAVPNPDYADEDDRGSINIKKSRKKVSDVEEARRVVREFIEENDLGSGNWPNGGVYKNGEKIGYISYNGKFWQGESMAKGGSTLRTVKLTLSDKDSYDYTYKQDGSTAAITFGFGKEPFEYEVKKISKSLEPLKEDILDTFTIQGIRQHEYKGGFSEAIKNLDTSILYGYNEYAKGGDIYDDMDEDIEVANKKAGYLFHVLKGSGYKPYNLEEANYDSDASIDISEKTHISVSLDGEIAVVTEVGDGKFRFIDAGTSISSMLQTLKKLDKKYLEKGGYMAMGGKLVGKQKNLDVNKNGKLDAEDFKMLRGEKMAKGGEIKSELWNNIRKIADGDVFYFANPQKVSIGNYKDIKPYSAQASHDGDISIEFMQGDYSIDFKNTITERKENRESFEKYRGLINVSEPLNKKLEKEILSKVLSDKMAMGGKVKFEDKVKSIKASLLKRKKVSPKVQKDYGKTYSPKEAEESAKRIAGALRAKYDLKKKFKKGGKTIAQTPAPKKDRVFGSAKNKPGSASSKKTASKIELNESILKTLSEKAKTYNEKHSSKVSTSTLKAVMRRGMGAYSTSHRPTISGGAPNSRQAWGFARVNKFLLKKGGTKVKAAYVQDDDLL